MNVLVALEQGLPSRKRVVKNGLEHPLNRTTTATQVLPSNNINVNGCDSSKNRSFWRSCCCSSREYHVSPQFLNLESDCTTRLSVPRLEGIRVDGCQATMEPTCTSRTSCAVSCKTFYLRDDH